MKGPHGELKRTFRHLPLVLHTTKDAKRVKVATWQGKKSDIACLRTVCSHLNNMFTGVTKQFEYKMRFVYSHFPINLNIIEGGKVVEIRNFLGEKRVRIVKLLPGVVCEKSTNVKDEIALKGTDLELVSRSGDPAGSSAEQLQPNCFAAVVDYCEGSYWESGVHAVWF